MHTKYILGVILLIVVLSASVTPNAYAAKVIFSPEPLNLLAPDNNEVSFRVDLVKNHRYTISYTMPTLRCTGGSCDYIIVDWEASDGSYFASWGTIYGSDPTYNAGTLYTAYINPDITDNFFATDNNGAVDLTIIGYCTEADGATWANCHIPDIKITDLDAADPIKNEGQPKVSITPPPDDKTPPVINLTTKPNKVVKEFPSFSGVARDNKAVSLIEYSTDGGKNWLDAESTNGLGGKQVDFSFKPPNIEDGNYTVLARATDSSGNRSSTQAFKIVVDRLPPIVGGFVMNIGPIVLKPNNQSLIQTVTDVEQKITLSAVGGPVSINLAAKQEGGGKTASFSLTESAHSGLWSDVLSFTESGNYQLTVNSTDGAGNKTSRSLGTINAVSPGRIIQKDTNAAIANAKLKLYAYEPESASWVVWDAASYGQTNPQIVDKNGDFSYFLPQGRYYIKVSAESYKPITTDIFELDRPTPLSATLTMVRRHSWLGWLDWFDFSTQKLQLDSTSSANSSAVKLLGQALPSFSLEATTDKQVNSLDWLGKPTLLSFNTTWSPASSEQLEALAKLQKNPDVNVIAVGLEENANKLKAYSSIAGLELTWLADPDGSLVDDFDTRNIPVNYFIGRKGIIRQVVSGVLSEAELNNGLLGL